ncbi:FecCD family ABC transporter permease [Shimia sagamensis]|uniref:Iron complex transport system permease protein n=1 Tax=Shimia sagamensis TaxID=1566352 RepID=A0ABY1P0D7_9RHOB|nr:iron ABC transporter permease [Shimia sagamensis]SMP23398.1 iron complex transport system permease protein [Shimia sagamensis]
MTRRARITLPSLVLLLTLAFVWSLSVGAVKIPASVIINTLFDLDGDQQRFIINRSRLPRSLLAVLTGGAMALSGVIVQALLRNALASPKIIGINSGAALAVLLGTSLAPDLALAWLPLVALLGGTLAAGTIYGLSALRPMSPERLILVGIAVGLVCDAGVDFIMVTASTFEISAPLVWLTGSLWARGWQHLSAVWPFLSLLSALCLCLFFRLDLMRLGTSQATALGVNVRLERFVLLAIATLLASISVSVVGVIGFVGLMAPHIARQLVGGRHGVLLPTAMLIGALLVVLADATGRVLVPPLEISAGILTALFGAPFFVFILLTSRMETRE